MGLHGFFKKFAIGVKHVTHIMREIGFGDIIYQGLQLVGCKQWFSAIETDGRWLICIFFDQIDNTLGVAYRIRIFKRCIIYGAAVINGCIEGAIDTALTAGLAASGYREMDIERECFRILEFKLVPPVYDKSIVGAEVAQPAMVNDLRFNGI